MAKKQYAYPTSAIAALLTEANDPSLRADRREEARRQLLQYCFDRLEQMARNLLYGRFRQARDRNVHTTVVMSQLMWLLFRRPTWDRFANVPVEEGQSGNDNGGNTRPITTVREFFQRAQVYLRYAILQAQRGEDAPSPGDTSLSISAEDRRANPAQQAELLDLLKKVSAAIRTLPQEQCEAMQLRLSGYPPIEIAEILDKTDNAVRALLVRARKALREQFPETEFPA